MSMELHESKCKSREGGVAPMNDDHIAEHLKRVDGWEREGALIRKEFSFEDFKRTMAFVQQVALLAEEEGHHPELHISYGKLVVELTTHAIDGLSENDFIVAAKIDAL